MTRSPDSLISSVAWQPAAEKRDRKAFTYRQEGVVVQTEPLPEIEASWRSSFPSSGAVGQNVQRRQVGIAVGVGVRECEGVDLATAGASCRTHAVYPGTWGSPRLIMSLVQAYPAAICRLARLSERSFYSGQCARATSPPTACDSVRRAIDGIGAGS
jgi:hypothetical protein